LRRAWQRLPGGYFLPRSEAGREPAGAAAVEASRYKRHVRVRAHGVSSSKITWDELWHSACFVTSLHEEPQRWPQRGPLGHRLVSSMSIVMAAKETTVKAFLIFSGTLAMLIGLVAMIEGNLHCLGLLRRKKGRP